MLHMSRRIHDPIPLKFTLKRGVALMSNIIDEHLRYVDGLPTQLVDRICDYISKAETELEQWKKSKEASQTKCRVLEEDIELWKSAAIAWESMAEDWMSRAEKADVECADLRVQLENSKKEANTERASLRAQLENFRSYHKQTLAELGQCRKFHTDYQKAANERDALKGEVSGLKRSVAAWKGIAGANRGCPGEFN